MSEPERGLTLPELPQNVSITPPILAEQIRMTERFDAHVSAMGFPGGTEHYAVTTDYWVSPGLDLGRNPLIALLATASTALAQSDRSFVQQEHYARDAALQGTPLRTVISSSSVSDENSSSHSSKNSTKNNIRTIEITSLRGEAQSDALFQVPADYKVKQNNGVSF
ncbi:MAG: hypothetical protein ACR2M1_14800 [Gemmatimonadaceae bacterium]